MIMHRHLIRCWSIIFRKLRMIRKGSILGWLLLRNWLRRKLWLIVFRVKKLWASNLALYLMQLSFRLKTGEWWTFIAPKAFKSKPKWTKKKQTKTFNNSDNSMTLKVTSQMKIKITSSQTDTVTQTNGELKLKVTLPVNKNITKLDSI
jgi:hypothetical protein